MKSALIAIAGMALLSSVAARAADGQQILAQWRATVKASAVRQGEVHLVRQGSDDNLPTVTDEWVGAGGDYHVRTDRTYDSDEIVLKRGQAIRRDWDGHFRALNGDELRRLRAEAFTARVLAFGPPGDIAVSDVHPGADACCDVLTLTPPGGTGFVWTIDRKTHLPVSSTKPEGEGDVTTAQYEDWSASPWGTLIPHRIAVIDTDRVPAHFTVRSTTFLTAQSAADFAYPVAGPSDVRMTSDTAVLPFTLEANHIVIPVSVNGHAPTGFIFDTGDASEGLNATRLPSLGVASYGKTSISGGGQQVQSAYARDVTLGFADGVVLANQHAETFDDTGLERALGVPNGGILGYDFISRFVIEIDYGKKLMILHNPETWSYRGTGAIVPITFDDGIPYVEARLSIPTNADLPAHMVADFGAAGSMTFTAPFVKANNLVALIGTNKTVTHYAGLEKEYFAQTNSRGLVPELRLGGIVERDIPVSLSANTSGAYGTGQFAGTIGETVYSRYRVFLDYPHNRIIFESTPEAANPFKEGRTFGLTLIAAGDDLHTFIVTAVGANSPAAGAGFQAKDEITAMNGKPSSEFALSDLRGALAKEGETDTFTVKRGGKLTEIKTAIALMSVER
jgi:PDZ domain-containing protein